MSRIWAQTARKNPGLHVWREGTTLAVNLRPVGPPDSGWIHFEYDFEPLLPERVGFMLFNFDALGRPADHEKYERFIGLNAGGAFPTDIFLTEGASRFLTQDPRASSEDLLTIHLISQSRYRPSELFLWNPASGLSRRVPMERTDALGPVFKVTLNSGEKSYFNFKFIRKQGEAFTAFEPDFANRWWSAHDGAEIWTHSEASEITSAVPARKKLTLHFRQELTAAPRLHVWQLNSDYATNVDSLGVQHGWFTFETEFYTNMRYGAQFWNPDMPEAERWENAAAKRELQIRTDTKLWTLEGAKTVFTLEPQPNSELNLTVALRPPFSTLHGPLRAEIRVDRARALLAEKLVTPNNTVTVKSFADVRTVIRFTELTGQAEGIEGHPIVLGMTPVSRQVVLDRPPLLEQAPPADLFQNPPFNIRRPGAYEENGFIHFALHAPDAAMVELIGEWTNWRQHRVMMRSTADGAYWWARVAKAELLLKLGRPDYHGAKYRFLFNQIIELQDPAAGWVESSWNGASSLLIDPSVYQWSDASWERPGFDYYSVYQIHPARFSSRHDGVAPLRQVAQEIKLASGYLQEFGITAILLMPLNEVGTNHGWGYDPAFFYAIERAYGGPDALKEFVDACHQHGIAVLIDVVFNHAGNIDNILWSVARSSFFDGDTGWGSMINFDHPQCRHFFAQNLVYLAQEYHIDGFRLDHTYTILHSDEQNWYVREPGSGGGWEFMHALRRALHSEVDPRVLLMAEHLPNEWQLTNFRGPMDTQWCDHFHDRLIDACRGQNVMSALADAFKITHTHTDDWHKATNYPESHDEVGNVRDRVTFVAGWKRGLRMSKVAATATLLSRGLPMFFMGAEAGEDVQFTNGETTTLDLNAYLQDGSRLKLREWWKEMLALRRSPFVTGPSPLDVRFAQDQILAFSRGGWGELYVLLNFGGWSGWKSLGDLNLPAGTYCEWWNSTWPAFAIAAEDEDEHMNWGRIARLNGSHWLNIPDYGAIVLSRVD